MSDSLLGKYGLGPRASAVQIREAEEAELAEDQGCFGLCRGQRERVVHLELIKADGSIFAPSYSWIEKMHFDPSGTITIHAGETILITGRNLNRSSHAQIGLFSALTRHRVCWIRQADHATVMRTRDEEPLVEKIEW